MLETLRDIADLSYREGHYAHEILELLFPSGGQGSTLLQMVGLVSSVVVIVGACWLVLQLIEGYARVAHNAEAMREYNSIWTPLRVVFGVGLLVPLPSGASTFHHVLHAAVMVGSNLADAVHDKQITDVIEGGRPLVAYSAVGKEVVAAVAEREVCAAVVAATAENHAQRRPEPIDAGGITQTKLTRTTWYGSYEASQYVLWNWGQCGSVSFPLPADEPDFGEARRAATEDAILAVREVAERIGPIFAQGTSGMEDRDSPDWIAIIGQAGLVPRAIGIWMHERGREWDAAVADAASAISASQGEDGRTRVAEYQRAHGWPTAALTARLTAQTSATVQGLTSQKPALTDPGLDEHLDRRYRAARSLVRQLIQVDAPTLAANDIAEAGDEVSGVLTKALAPITRGMTEGGLSSEWSPDPVGDLVRFGHLLIAVFWAAVAAGALAMAASDNFFAAFVGASGSLGFLLDMIKPLMWGVLLVGVLYAIVLPSVVFILSILSIVSWLVAVAEAMIALPLYAMMMLRVRGTEMWDQALRPGLYFLLGVVLRPALMVLAIAFASVLISASLNLLNRLWALGFLGQQGGYVGGPELIVAGLILLAWLQWQIFLRLATLTLTMPERIFAWTGAQMQGHGDDNFGAGLATGMAAGVSAANRGGIDTSKLAGSGEDGKKDGGSITRGK